MTQDNGLVVEKIGHDQCGSSDALVVYQKADGSHDGYCWSCNTWVPDPYGEKDGQPKGKRGNLVVRCKTPEQLQQEMLDVYYNYRPHALSDRGIRHDVVEYFDVRVGLDPVRSTQPVEHFYPYYRDGHLTGYKKRLVEKKIFFSVGSTRGCELFGQWQAKAAGGKRLFITEGECDAMALFQVLKDGAHGTEWAGLNPAVVSVPSGAAGALKAIGSQFEFVNSFDEIVIVPDQDEAGQQYVDEVCAMFDAGKIKIASFSLKDANQMLLEGRADELKKAVVWRASVRKPSSIVSVMDVFEDARRKPSMGIPWPWPTLTKATYGIPRPALIGVGAGVGVGKTSFWHQLIEYLTCVQGRKVGVLMLEEPSHKTLKMIAGKFAHKKFHDPTAEYTQQELDQSLLLLEDKLTLFNSRGEKNWTSIKEAIKHMVLVEGCKDIILDPLTAMTFHLSSSETNDELNLIMGELAGMVDRSDFTCYYSSHLNPPPKEFKPHEEGGRVKLAQFTGSKAMIKWSHLILGIERNTQDEDEVMRNTAMIRLLKDREHGHRALFPVYYDQNTGDFLEPEPAPEPEKPEGVTY